jgi:hypothetical protein
LYADFGKGLSGIADGIRNDHGHGFTDMPDLFLCKGRLVVKTAGTEKDAAVLSRNDPVYPDAVFSLGGIHGQNPGMGVLRSKNLGMEGPWELDIGHIPGGSGDLVIPVDLLEGLSDNLEMILSSHFIHRGIV